MGLFFGEESAMAYFLGFSSFDLKLVIASNRDVFTTYSSKTTSCLVCYFSCSRLLWHVVIKWI